MTATTASTGSTLIRRQLGRRLRELREAAGKRPADVETAHIASTPTLRRVEHGYGGATPPRVRALCHLYGVDPDVTEHLVSMAIGAMTPGWWEAYDVPTWFGMYVGLEASASAINAYQPEIVDGLLQTPAYSRAVFAAWAAIHDGHDPEIIERKLEVRRERQRAVFDRENPPQLRMLLGQATLHRLVGGREVMVEQIQHLLSLSQRDHVEIRVLPWESGPHALEGGQVTILDFEDPADPDVVYLESHEWARYLEQPDEVARHRAIFEYTFNEQAIPIEEHLS